MVTTRRRGSAQVVSASPRSHGDVVEGKPSRRRAKVACQSCSSSGRQCAQSTASKTAIYGVSVIFCCSLLLPVFFAATISDIGYDPASEVMLSGPGLRSSTNRLNHRIPLSAFPHRAPSALGSASSYSGNGNIEALTAPASLPTDGIYPTFEADWHSWTESVQMVLHILLKTWAVLTAIACTAVALRRRQSNTEPAVDQMSVCNTQGSTPQVAATAPKEPTSPINLPTETPTPIKTTTGPHQRPPRPTDSAMNTPLPVTSTPDREVAVGEGSPALLRVQSSPMPSLRRPIIVERRVINGGGPKRGLNFASKSDQGSSTPRSEVSFDSVDDKAYVPPSAWQQKLDKLEKALAESKRENMRLHQQLREQMAPREDFTMSEMY